MNSSICYKDTFYVVTTVFLTLFSLIIVRLEKCVLCYTNMHNYQPFIGETVCKPYSKASAKKMIKLEVTIAQWWDEERNAVRAIVTITAM